MDLQLTQSSLAIDPLTNDLVLVDGLDAIAQDLTTRLRFFLGEWFLDQGVGVDFYGKVLVKNPSMPDIMPMFSKVITTTPGVKSITQALAWSYDGQARAMTLSCKADTIAGPLTYTREIIL
jgi:hypothetical protein